MFIRAITLSALSCLAGACTSIVNIDVDESDSFNDFEASVPLANTENLRLRVRGSAIDGNFSQSIVAGERINIEGATIAGPEEIDGDFDLNYWSVAVGFGGSDDPYHSRPTTSGYIGLGRTDFDLSLRNGGSRFPVSDSTTEAYFQYRFLHPLSDSLAIGFGASAGLSADLDGSREYELILQYRVSKNLIISGGYRWFDYFYVSELNDSDIEFNLRGPVLGLKIPL